MHKYGLSIAYNNGKSKVNMQAVYLPDYDLVTQMDGQGYVAFPTLVYANGFRGRLSQVTAVIWIHADFLQVVQLEEI